MVTLTTSTREDAVGWSEAIVGMVACIRLKNLDRPLSLIVDFFGVGQWAESQDLLIRTYVLIVLGSPVLLSSFSDVGLILPRGQLGT